MYGIPIENHEAISAMSIGYARDVLRIHESCPMSVCGKKRQAIAVIRASERTTGSRP